jgi:hypothetical protein
MQKFEDWFMIKGQEKMELKLKARLDQEAKHLSDKERKDKAAVAFLKWLAKHQIVQMIKKSQQETRDEMDRQRKVEEERKKKFRALESKKAYRDWKEKRDSFNIYKTPTRKPKRPMSA